MVANHAAGQLCRCHGRRLQDAADRYVEMIDHQLRGGVGVPVRDYLSDLMTARQHLLVRLRRLPLLPDLWLGLLREARSAKAADGQD